MNIPLFFTVSDIEVNVQVTESASLFKCLDVINVLGDDIYATQKPLLRESPT